MWRIVLFKEFLALDFFLIHPALGARVSVFHFGYPLPERFVHNSWCVCLSVCLILLHPIAARATIIILWLALVHSTIFHIGCGEYYALAFVRSVFRKISDKSGPSNDDFVVVVANDYYEENGCRGNFSRLLGII